LIKHSTEQSSGDQRRITFTNITKTSIHSGDLKSRDGDIPDYLCQGYLRRIEKSSESHVRGLISFNSPHGWWESKLQAWWKTTAAYRHVYDYVNCGLTATTGISSGRQHL